MARLLFVLVLCIIPITIQGFPGTEEDISRAIAARRWSDVQRILSEHARQSFQWSPLLAADVKDLKPIDGGHVYGESQFTFHSSSNINGRTKDESGGHKVINEDGRVTEFDFKP